MKHLLTLLALAFCVSLAVPTPAYAKTDDDAAADAKGNKRAPRNARQEKAAPNTSALGDFAKEFPALKEAELLLDTVADEKTAQSAAKKLLHDFTILPVPMGGNNAQLEEYARAVNRVNLKMEKLKGEPWFVSSGLQAAWTLITVPSTRRTASMKR